MTPGHSLFISRFLSLMSAHKIQKLPSQNLLCIYWISSLPFNNLTLRLCWTTSLPPVLTCNLICKDCLLCVFKSTALLFQSRVEESSLTTQSNLRNSWLGAGRLRQVVLRLWQWYCSLEVLCSKKGTSLFKPYNSSPECRSSGICEDYQ